MKEIMISIQPKYVAGILNGKKIMEIRKTTPKCDLPIDVYIYCTKGKPKILDAKKRLEDYLNERYYSEECVLNGKVVSKFTLNKVEEIKCLPNTYQYETPNRNMLSLIKSACLDVGTLDDYLNRKIGYAWHIDNLEIFDKPKELYQFYGMKKAKSCLECMIGVPSKFCKNCLVPARLTKAPQSWCYVEKEI